MAACAHGAGSEVYLSGSKGGVHCSGVDPSAYRSKRASRRSNGTKAKRANKRGTGNPGVTVRAKEPLANTAFDDEDLAALGGSDDDDNDVVGNGQQLVPMQHRRFGMTANEQKRLVERMMAEANEHNGNTTFGRAARTRQNVAAPFPMLPFSATAVPYALQQTFYLPLTQLSKLATRAGSFMDGDNLVVTIPLNNPVLHDEKKNEPMFVPECITLHSYKTVGFPMPISMRFTSTTREGRRQHWMNGFNLLSDSTSSDRSSYTSACAHAGQVLGDVNDNAKLTLFTCDRDHIMSRNFDLFSVVDFAAIDNQLMYKYADDEPSDAAEMYYKMHADDATMPSDALHYIMLRNLRTLYDDASAAANGSMYQDMQCVVSTTTGQQLRVPRGQLKNLVASIQKAVKKESVVMNFLQSAVQLVIPMYEQQMATLAGVSKGTTSHRAADPNVAVAITVNLTGHLLVRKSAKYVLEVDEPLPSAEFEDEYEDEDN